MEITCASGTVEVAVVVYNYTTSATTSTTFVTKQINSINCPNNEIKFDFL